MWIGSSLSGAKPFMGIKCPPQATSQSPLLPLTPHTHTHTLPRNVLVTASVLDFDLNPDLRRWQLRVTVSDSLFEDEAILTILLQDINDNAPQFANTSYQSVHSYSGGTTIRGGTTIWGGGGTTIQGGTTIWGELRGYSQILTLRSLPPSPPNPLPPLSSGLV